MTFLETSVATFWSNERIFMSRFRHDEDKIMSLVQECMDSYETDLKIIHGLTNAQSQLFFKTIYVETQMFEKDIRYLIGIDLDNVDVDNTSVCILNLNLDREVFKHIIEKKVEDFKMIISCNERIFKMVHLIKNTELDVPLDERGQSIYDKFVDKRCFKKPDVNSKYNYVKPKVDEELENTILRKIINLIQLANKSYKDIKRDMLHDILRKEFDSVFENRVQELLKIKIQELNELYTKYLEKARQLPLSDDFNEVYEVGFRENFVGPIVQKMLRDEKKSWFR